MLAAFLFDLRRKSTGKVLPKYQIPGWLMTGNVQLPAFLLGFAVIHLVG
jgi:hypothetical protein